MRTGLESDIWTGRESPDSDRGGRVAMAAFVVIDVEITDASLCGQFMESVTGTVESYGGTFAVRSRPFTAIASPRASPS